MTASRLALAALAVVGAASAAESLVSQAAARAEQKAAQAPQPLAMEFRLRVAQALRERDPERSRKLLEATLAELRGGNDQAIGPVHAAGSRGTLPGGRGSSLAASTGRNCSGHGRGFVARQPPG